MSVLIFPFMNLPIYLHTIDDYYGEYAKKKSEPGKKYLEKIHRKPFEQLPKDFQILMEEQWHLPPWQYNDVVGFLQIGTDGGDYLTGEIYLRRKYFPKNSRHRNQYKTTLQNQEFLPYSDIGGYKIDLSLNSDYIEALEKLQLEAKKTLKKRNRSFLLSKPLFPPKHIDLVKAYEEIIKDDR